MSNELVMKAENIVNNYDKIFNEMGLRNIDLISKSEFDSAMEALEYLQKIGNTLIANYDAELIKTCLQYRSNIDRDIFNLKSEKSILENCFSILILSNVIPVPTD